MLKKRSKINRLWHKLANSHYGKRLPPPPPPPQPEIWKFWLTLLVTITQGGSWDVVLYIAKGQAHSAAWRLLFYVPGSPHMPIKPWKPKQWEQTDGTRHKPLPQRHPRCLYLWAVIAGSFPKPFSANIWISAYKCHGGVLDLMFSPPKTSKGQTCVFPKPTDWPNLEEQQTSTVSKVWWLTKPLSPTRLNQKHGNGQLD